MQVLNPSTYSSSLKRLFNLVNKRQILVKMYGFALSFTLCLSLSVYVCVCVCLYVYVCVYIYVYFSKP